MIRAELERRPLLVFCLGLIVGLTLARHPIHFLFLLPCYWLLTGFRSRAWLTAGFVIGAFLGPGRPPAMLLERTPVRGDWRVATMPAIQPFGQTCEIERDGVRLSLTYQGSRVLVKGATIRLTGIAKPVKEGALAFFEQRNLVGRVDATESEVEIAQEAPWIYGLASAWRGRFLNLTARNLSPRDSALLDSMCFHVNGGIDDGTKDEILASGAVHLLQSSGLQAILIAQSLFWLFSWLPAPRWAQILVVAAILGLYVVATGSSPSILRAVTMSLLAQCAYLVRREPDWPSALALSSILYLFWFPGGVYEVGFQLTFLAVLTMSAFSTPVKWRPGFEAWAYRIAIRSLRSSVVAYAAIAPLIAFYFGSVSLVTVPIGLLIAAAAVPAVVLSMAACALPISSLAGLGLKATAPLVWFIDSVLGAFGGPGLTVRTPAFSGYWLVLYYGLLLALWRPRARQP
ncbi:MAG TPA: ComEC/Rec2 family competence protein [Fimbriimonadaceae bacterium]|nr:ComEC/Rec2 family competence protein [Fimbriimonadaceae bacterium]